MNIFAIPSSEKLSLIAQLLFPLFLGAQKNEFALIGDMPYLDVHVKKIENLIQELNEDKPIKWVMHTGDIKSGVPSYTDDYFRSRLNLYQKIENPLIDRRSYKEAFWTKNDLKI